MRQSFEILLKFFQETFRHIVNSLEYVTFGCFLHFYFMLLIHVFDLFKIFLLLPLFSFFVVEA